MSCLNNHVADKAVINRNWCWVQYLIVCFLSVLLLSLRGLKWSSALLVPFWSWFAGLCRVPKASGSPWFSDLHLLHIKILYLNFFFVLSKAQLHFSNYETNVGRKQIWEFRFCYFSRTDLSESDSIKISRFRFAHTMENCCH